MSDSQPVSVYKIGFISVLTSLGNLKMKAVKLLDLWLGTILCALCPAKPSWTGNIPTFKRILIIRPGGIGDALFLLPFLRSFRQKYPTITIDILGEKRNAEIFQGQKELDAAIYRFDVMGELLNLFKNKYDVIIDTEQWHYLSALVGYFLGAPVSIGFATRPSRAKLFNIKIPYEIAAHELNNFGRLFFGLMPEAQNIHTVEGAFIVAPHDLSWAKTIVSVPYATLFLGASIALRRLTRQQIEEIINCLLIKNQTIVLLGGRDVQKEGASIAQNFSTKPVLDLTGKTSLRQSAALIKSSQLFIGPDSGLMHLACAVETPTVAIFGPGNLRKWTPPANPKYQVVTLNVACSPCTQFGYTVPTCAGRYMCVRDIKTANITTCIENQLKAS